MGGGGGGGGMRRIGAWCEKRMVLAVSQNVGRGQRFGPFLLASSLKTGHSRQFGQKLRRWRQREVTVAGERWGASMRVVAECDAGCGAAAPTPAPLHAGTRAYPGTSARLHPFAGAGALVD